MKKFFISAVFLTAFSLGYSQQAPGQEDTDMENWYHKDFATTNVYGVNTDNAYKFLESKGLKPQTVIVGVLDSGVQVDHPGLATNMWVNAKEIPGNGIDDDKNGYIDDVHGWNFQGGKDGDVDVDTMEVTRMVKKYQSVFEGPDSEKNKENQAKMPEEFAMYMKSKKIFSERSSEAQTGYQRMQGLVDNIDKTLAMLNGQPLTEESVAAIKAETPEQEASLNILKNIVKSPDLQGKKAEELSELLKADLEGGLNYYKSQAEKQFNLDYDPRSIVGDDYENVNERNYGNNHYEGPDASHGTHVSGIIAGIPSDTISQHGIAYKVAKIMTVRAVPDGDERDKDVANAIRYAVDNGAKVLNMSFGKPVSPEKEAVWDAFKYAQDKGVLLVKAAGNDNENIQEDMHFPTEYKDPNDAEPFVNNVITVGASTNNNDRLRASFSNYNHKMVAVFAPGAQIYSTIPHDKYAYFSGTSMASPVVAGAAAALLAYMPDLTPAQIIESLVKTVNKSTVDANIGTDVNNTFNYISQSGGVIDLYKAAEYAYEHFYNANKANTKKTSEKVKA